MRAPHPLGQVGGPNPTPAREGRTHMDRWEHCILTTTTAPAVVIAYPDHTVVSRHLSAEGGRIDYDAAVRDATADLARDGWEEIARHPAVAGVRPEAVRVHFRRPTRR